jgi:hypothetical protein
VLDFSTVGGSLSDVASFVRLGTTARLFGSVLRRSVVTSPLFALLIWARSSLRFPRFTRVGSSGLACGLGCIGGSHKSSTIFAFDSGERVHMAGGLFLALQFVPTVEMKTR